jgi:hypothetical protein
VISWNQLKPQTKIPKIYKLITPFDPKKHNNPITPKKKTTPPPQKRKQTHKFSQPRSKKQPKIPKKD